MFPLVHVRRIATAVATAVRRTWAARTNRLFLLANAVSLLALSLILFRLQAPVSGTMRIEQGVAL